MSTLGEVKTRLDPTRDGWKFFAFLVFPVEKDAAHERAMKDKRRSAKASANVGKRCGAMEDEVGEDR